MTGCCDDSGEGCNMQIEHTGISCSPMGSVLLSVISTYILLLKCNTHIKSKQATDYSKFQLTVTNIFVNFMLSDPEIAV